MNIEPQKFYEIVKQAKEASKQNFLTFAKEFFDADSELFEHLWHVPIISTEQTEGIISTTLSTQNHAQILDIINNTIEGELGDANGAFITFDKFATHFTDEEIAEYKSKMDDIEKYDAIIVYDKEKVIEGFSEFLAFNPDIPNDEYDTYLKFYLMDLFSHELCHLNANTLLCDTKDSELDELVNGSMLSFAETNGKLNLYNSYLNTNEVLIDTLNNLTNKYRKINSIEGRLHKIIESRGGMSTYDKMDDTLVLSLYVLFPEELTKWAMFGAYDDCRTNLLEEKINQVYGDDFLEKYANIQAKYQLYPEDGIDELSDFTLRELTKYCKKTDIRNLSDNQIDMLEMLGVTEIRNIHSLNNCVTLQNIYKALQNRNRNNPNI